MASSVNFGLQEMLLQNDWEHLVVMAGDMPWFDPSVFWTDEVAVPVEKPSLIPTGIQYPEGIGMPLLLSRTFVAQHCYFVSQKNAPTLPLRKSLHLIEVLRTRPPGPDTRDVDRPEDLSID